jgi:hypothetical protein
MQARRVGSSPWRDPRVIAGVLLVLASTVIGGFVVAAADHTESFWALGRDVRAGESVRRDDLVAVRAKVPARTSRSLLRTDRPLPARLADLRWASDAHSGTLVTDSSLATRRRAVELPIAVGTGGLPGDLRRGDRVDVWSVPERVDDGTRGSKPGTARRLMSSVRVVSRSSATGITGGAGVTLVVDAAGTTIDGRLMAALSSGRITIVRVS